MKWYETKVFRVVMRFVRVAGATGIAAIVADIAGDAKYLTLAPVLVAAGKWVRETLPHIFGKWPV